MGQTKGVAHSVRWADLGEIRPALPRISGELLEQCIRRTQRRIRTLVAAGESREAQKEQERLEAMKLCRRPFR